MQLDNIIVTIAGIGVVVFIYWFFLMKKEKAVVAGDVVDITVKGGYSPDTIAVAKGKKTTKTFSIKGMHCASCVTMLERALKQVDGVSQANVNLAIEKATVSYDPQI